jgi:outer membrane immunogenic protein
MEAAQRQEMRSARARAPYVDHHKPIFVYEDANRIRRHSFGTLHMSRLLAAASALTVLAVASTASAADLAARSAPVYTKAPEYVQAFNWTGFYVGGHIGGAWTDNVSYTGVDPTNTLELSGGSFVPASTSGHGSGVMGGLQLGYNWQVAPNFLLGVEGDFSGAGINFSTRQSPLISESVAGDSFFSTTEKVRSVASIRGRAGFTSGDWLFFGTAGWGWANTRFSADAACPATGTNNCGRLIHAPLDASFSRSGAAYGAGIDYHLPSTQWVLGLEYLRYDFGGISTTAATINGDPGSISYTASSLHLNEVRVSASYKFGGANVAKY